MSFHVSVIIPIFNAEAYVRQAVESAAALAAVGEVLLINDFGPDCSWKVCRQLAGEFSKVRLLEHADGRNHGAGASRNLGIQNARCEYIAFLDADDWFLKHRFEVDQQVLTSDASIDGVYNALGNFYESPAMRELWISQGRPELLTLSAPVPPEELAQVLLHGHPTVTGEFSTDTITLRKRVFETTGYFHPELRLQQDTHMWKRLSVACRLAAGNLTTPVAIRRVHPQNRMTRVADHRLYMDIWYSSLWEEFLRLAARPDILNQLRLNWCHHQIRAGRKLSATSKLLRWLLCNPRKIAIPYGQFDFAFRALCENSRWGNRLLSAKNRLIGHVKPVPSPTHQHHGRSCGHGRPPVQ
jgi:glycosyltransferase involved in cell wall biosynthesis